MSSVGPGMHVGLIIRVACASLSLCLSVYLYPPPPHYHATGRYSVPDAPMGGGLNTTLIMSVASPAGDRLPVAELSTPATYAYSQHGGGGCNDGTLVRVC
jgi:hypothetical protein